MFNFLRNLDKRKLIFILQRAVAILLPIRPYPECGQNGICPCPLRQGPAQINGVAVGRNHAHVEIHARQQFPSDSRIQMA